LDKSEGTRDQILDIAEHLVFENGFNGTSLSDIMTAAGLTKGAFFHHFRDKNELARAVLDRWARREDVLTMGFSERAAALADDPLQEAVLFLKLFEEWLESLDKPLGGCMFASYTYENQLFDDSMRKFITEGLNRWMAIYERIFERLLAAHRPRISDLSARDLTEQFATVVEGGLVLTRALEDPDFLVRRIRQYRQYLMLLFDQKI
jgi:TetR/AcrR family transcriptional repressor of nem operon